MTEYSEIILDNRNGIATITLNRPERLNAWTGTMQAELKDAILTAGEDRDVRCIVVTGAGRGFCAGADMEVLQAIQPGQGGSNDKGMDTLFADAPGPDVAEHFSGRFGYLYACPKPVIAAINGPCAGVGFVFALYADLRFAALEAKFTTAFSKIGLIAEHGMSWILPRLIGEANALDILWLRGQDLNLRPSGYEPDELPGCSIPRLALASGNIWRRQKGQPGGKPFDHHEWVFTRAPCAGCNAWRRPTLPCLKT